MRLVDAHVKIIMNKSVYLPGRALRNGVRDKHEKCADLLSKTLLQMQTRMLSRLSLQCRPVSSL